MGMTVNKAIEIISDISKLYITLSNIQYQSLITAIETMRKYQKIQTILKDWNYGADSVDTMTAISEVLEDGKID